MNTPNVVRGPWQTQLPQEPGDWLWVATWSCECGCLRNYGIAYVVADGGDDDCEPQGGFRYTADDGTKLVCFWDQRQPSDYGNGTFDVTWWMKLEIFPPPDEDD